MKSLCLAENIIILPVNENECTKKARLMHKSEMEVRGELFGHLYNILKMNIWIIIF